MTRTLKLIVAGLVASAFAAGSASAAVRTAKLDSVASTFAGRPISAVCYTDGGNDVYDWNITYDLVSAYGVWFRSQPDVVFIGPDPCTAMLVQQESGLEDAGLRAFANGVRTLVHESFHARSNGVWSEADTEACAMKYLPQALNEFNVYSTKTIAVKQVRTRWVKRKVRGRMIRYRTSRVVTVWRDVANPDYSRLIGWATTFHNAAPAQYLNGVCPA